MLTTCAEKSKKSASLHLNRWKNSTSAMTPEINKFAELSQRKKILKESLDLIEKELAGLQPIVMTQFEQASTQSMRIQGLTLYMGSQLWAKKANESVTTDDMIKVLKEAKLDEYVSPQVRTSALSAYFRRCEELGEPVPECLKGVIDVSRRYEIKTRRS